MPRTKCDIIFVRHACKMQVKNKYRQLAFAPMATDDTADYAKRLKRDYESLTNDKRALERENKRLADKIRELVRVIRDK